MTERSRRSPCWGEPSEAEILKAVRIAEERGYRAAFDFLGSEFSGMSTHFMSGVRVDWIFHCYSHDRSSRCLDLGSGWGSLSFLLADLFDETVSLDRMPVLMNFQRLRSKEDNTQSLRLIAGDNLSLPFRDALFDLVVVNGVLEWAARGRDGDPRSVQMRFLKEIRRCLKPGGCLFIGIENRFGLPYWFGARDHTSLSFTSILPRRVADLVVRRALADQGWTKYDTYTHSSRGYESLLREAGYDPVELLWTYPTYSYPKFAGRIDDGESYSFLARHHLATYEDMRFFKKLACYVGGILPSKIMRAIASFFWPSYLIFAWNGPKPKTIEDEIAEAVPATSYVRMSGGDGAGSKITFVALKNGEVQSFTKFPRHLQDDGLEREEHLLSRYAGITASRVPSRCSTLFVERPVAGRLCSFHGLRDNETAVDWLLAFQDETASAPYTDDNAREEQAGTANVLSHLLPTDVLQQTNKACQEFLSSLARGKIPRCSEHGDFNAKNIIVKESGELSVMDWEFHRACGNPLFDFCFFIISSSMRPGAERSFEENLLGHGGYSTTISKLVRRFCTRKRLQIDTFVLGMPYTMSRCIARYSVYNDTGSPLRSQFASLLTLWRMKMSKSDFSWIEQDG